MFERFIRIRFGDISMNFIQIRYSRMHVPKYMEVKATVEK